MGYQPSCLTLALPTAPYWNGVRKQMILSIIRGLVGGATEKRMPSKYSECCSCTSLSESFLQAEESRM